MLPVLLTSSLLLSLAARAQDSTTNVEIFEPSADLYGYGATQSAATLGHLQVGAGFYLSYANDPLVLVGSDGRVPPTGVSNADSGDALLDSRTTAHMRLGMGITRFFSLTADLPLVLAQKGVVVDDLGSPIADPAAIAGSGLSDLRLQPKVPILDRDRMPIGLAVVVPLTLPTGKDSYLGEGGLTFTPLLVGEWSDGSIHKREYMLRAAANVGFLARNQARLRDVTVGNAFVYSAAVGVHPLSFLEADLEFHGQVFGGAPSQRPGELLLGLKGLVGRYLSVDLGFGKGIMSGVGSPDYRLWGGLTFAPSLDPEARDSDRDAIADGSDKCPKDAEDLDGFQDEDGCPDLDNDADTVPDLVDKCPNDPEDDDNYMDNDGCPETDNDKDAIADVSDRCPDEAETMNGYQDEDGCPDDKPVEDSDGDGYLDDLDLCPYAAEDMDKFSDEDGCPDPDNDNDGILDAQDKCPGEREVFNGVEDEDGCPDESKRVVLTQAAIEINEAIYFDFAKATIQERSFDLLNEIAAVMVAHPELKRIRVEGHTDNVGDDITNLKLSQARADSVKKALIERGVDAARLDAAGFGEMRPIVGNDTDADRAKNRRVEFIIVSRELQRVEQ